MRLYLFQNLVPEFNKTKNSVVLFIICSLFVLEADALISVIGLRKFKSFLGGKVLENVQRVSKQR